MSKQVRGATVMIRWHDEQEPKEAFFSFGEYDEETGCDSFGTNDDAVMFYCEGVEELEQLKNGQRGEFPLGFDVLEYVLEFVEAEGVES